MNFTLEPTFPFILENYPDLTHSLVFNDSSVQVNSAIYNIKTKLVEVTASYTSSIQSVPLSLQFNMPQNALSYAIPVSYTNLLVDP